MKPPVLILHASGTNRDRDAAWSCELAGGRPSIVHINNILNGQVRLNDYRMLLFPGGFSHGDDLGAGRLWAVNLRHRLADQIRDFIAAGKPVLGICNGFQVLVKAGYLPGLTKCGLTNCGAGGAQSVGTAQDARTAQGAGAAQAADTVRCVGTEQNATLARNAGNRFECRWVYLQPDRDCRCIFTRDLEEPIYCPVAHGEGRFCTERDDVLQRLEADQRIALRYAAPVNVAPNDAAPVNVAPNAAAPDTAAPVEAELVDVAPGYPWNPNGSRNDVAGICNADGNVLGLMPHPENHVMEHQHPRYHRGQRGMSGLKLFRNGIRYAAEL